MTIDSGIGNDAVEIDGKLDGNIVGGSGKDLLIASGDIAQMDISGVERLSLNDEPTATRSELGAFGDIWAFGDELQTKPTRFIRTPAVCDRRFEVAKRRGDALLHNSKCYSAARL